MQTLDGSRAGVGPILSDGTPVADLIDVDRHEVSLRVLHDPEIYELELRRVFTRVWHVLAHESEVPNPGDFVTRFIGEDCVIVTRDDAAGIQVLLNVCSHRGMQVCRTGAGNSRQFRCPYHGWVFDRHGTFLGAPVAREQMHGDMLDKSDLGLRRARVDMIAGMIFATWDEQAPSLDDYLGDIKWYLELMFDRTESGLEVLGPPQRYMIAANWKLPSEQHNTDSYHTLSLHRSLMELGFMGDANDWNNDAAMRGYNVSSQGHGIRCVDEREAVFNAFKDLGVETMSPIDRLRLLPPPSLTTEMIPELSRRFDDDQLRVLAEYPPSVGGLFPNVGTFSLRNPVEDGLGAIISWHAFVPKGPHHFEFFNWFFVERDAPDDLRDRVSRASNLSFGSSGFVETDDSDTWPQITDSARGVIGREQTLKYQAIAGESQPDDWPGNGHVHGGFAKDDNQWHWWMRWREFMVGEPW